jgi:hypothetical protein
LYNKDSKAKELMMNAFFIAIQNGDTKQVQYYLTQKKELMNEVFEEYRAMDVALLGENLHLDMLKLLLSYKPELNYEIPYCKNFTLLQMLAINKKLGNRSYLAKILLENGANVNFHSKQGNGSTSSLVYSYISNNYELFQIFLKYGANLKDLNEKSRNLVFYIQGSYLVELIKYILQLRLSYSKKISKEVFPLVTKESYRIIHQKNLQYLNTIFKYKKLSDLSEKSIFNLAKFYAMTNETSGVKLLLKQGLCDRKNICHELYQIAGLNDNIAIMNILSKEK